MSEDQSCETPLEELMEADLKHYEEASSAVHTWSNQIPQAIRFWYMEKPKMEAKYKALAKISDMQEKHIAKMKDLFDPHNLMGL